MIFISFLLWNKYRPEESGVDMDMSTPVHPVAPPLQFNGKKAKVKLQFLAPNSGIVEVAKR